jgi:hypothetical protein
MDIIQHHRAMLAICRQRAQMEGESEAFWLEQAAILEKLLVTLERLRALGLNVEPALETA